MITPQETKIIMTVWGAKYATPLAAKLKARKVYNTEGRPLTPPSIVNYVRGVRENLEVEKAIMEATAAEKQRKDDLVRQRQLLFPQ